MAREFCCGIRDSDTSGDGYLADSTHGRKQTRVETYDCDLLIHYLISISMKTKSTSLALMTSCSTPDFLK